MPLRLNTFAGEIPKLDPRLLPEPAAQTSFNCKMVLGTLEALRKPLKLETFSSDQLQSVSRFNSRWLTWDVDVDTVDAPVKGQVPKLYYSGDGAPKVHDGERAYELGVPAPERALFAELRDEPSNPDTKLISTRLYTYTYVSNWGEESAPAPVSDFIEWRDGQRVALSGFAEAPAERRIEKLRLYRSQTTPSGTRLYLVAELDAATREYLDETPSTRLGEVLKTQDWTPPPAGLRGLTALPNGITAGFVGRTLWFSVPYVPYAYPESTTLTTDYDIVALGAFGTSVVVMTTGNPYLVSGTAPENMVMEKLEVNYPCIAKRGVVDMGYAVLYPSNDGLVMVSAAGATLYTGPLVSPDYWKRFNPSSLVASVYQQFYIASYTRHVPGLEYAERGMLIVDTSGEAPYLLRSNLKANGFYPELSSGRLFFVDGGELLEFDPMNEPYMMMVWRSKRFILPKPVNFGALRLDAKRQYSTEELDALRRERERQLQANRELFDSGGVIGALCQSDLIGLDVAGSNLHRIRGNEIDEQFAMVTLFADGRQVAQFKTINQTVKLPAGFKAREWEIELSGNAQIFELTMAATGAELGVV